jgi:hypothetical protein
MLQSKIMGHLCELAASGTMLKELTPDRLPVRIQTQLNDRFTEIMTELVNAASETVKGDVDVESVAITVLSCVLLDTYGNRPQCLPGLFPFFASLCGGGDEAVTVGKALLPNVEWSIMDTIAGGRRDA